LKPSSLILPAAATLFAIAFFATATVAQAPQAAPAQQPATNALPAKHHDHFHPAPTNLKVLPKNMTGEQVHEVMQQWESALGARCNTCHTSNLNHLGPNDRPQLNFADDSLPEKATARLMYTMTEEINKNYLGKIKSSGAPVTCGTCHQGHLGPEPFTSPKDGHNNPPPPQNK
jgi:cytochrome c553